MKKFLLFCLITLLNFVSAHAQSGEIVAYSTEIDGTVSKQTPTIDKSNFVGLRGGDYFKVTISDASSAILSMKDANIWDSFVYEAHPSNGVYTTVILTEKQASNIIESGLYIEIENAKITQISFCHSDAVPFWNGSHSFGWLFDISDNLKAFEGATTNDKIRFKGVLEGTGQHQLHSFYYCTGAGWAENAIWTETKDFSGSAGDEFVFYVDVTSPLISAINETSDDTKIRAYRIYGKGITLQEVELCTPLSLGESQNLACDAGDYIKVNLSRTITAGKWSTIVLPFAMTSEQLTSTFGVGVSVAELQNSSTANELIFNTVSATEANKPYAIKVATNFTSAYINDVTIESGTPTQSLTNWNFVGNYTTGTYIPVDSYYFNDNKLKKSTKADNHRIKPFRAYFTYTGSGSPALSRGFTIDGQTTGINATILENDEVSDGKIYNLNGQQIAQPSKGLYIKNGKKYIIK